LQVALQWAVQRGVNTCPFSLRENELAENLLVGTWELDQEDMDLIKTLDRQHHYLNPRDWYGLPLWN
jgi:diketogulonate reductase-like aldo/keto reductase